MKSGKLLKISNERSIYIIQNEDESYITQDMLIRYRNIGENFDKVFINESYCSIEQGMVNVLDNVGNPKFHFPLIWLDTNAMMLQSLIKKEYIKMN